MLIIPAEQCLYRLYKQQTTDLFNPLALFEKMLVKRKESFLVTHGFFLPGLFNYMALLHRKKLEP